jgi:NitT/TauT family transport system substrate-binding protein
MGKHSVDAGGRGFHGLALTLAAVLLAALSGAARAEPIQFGTTGRSDSTSIATYIALERKFFEAEKLEVNWIPAGSAARAVQQTVAGSLDISIAATDATVRAVAEGAGLAIIAGTVNAAPFRVVGAKSVTGWADLRSKLVSVGGPTDQTLFFLRIMARRNGLSDKDYDLIYAGTTPARFAQLMSGQVGAAVLTNPNDLMALGDGFRDLGVAPDYVPVWSQNNAFVNVAWAKSHRAETVAFLRALRRAVAYFYDAHNAEDVIGIMAKYTGSDRTIAQKTYEFYVEKNILPVELALNRDGIQAVIDSIVASGELKASIPASSVIDASFLAEAQK